MHQWVRSSLECISSMLFCFISILISFSNYVGCSEKKRNRFLTFIFVKWMLNVECLKRKSNYKSTSNLNQPTDKSLKNVGFFHSDQRHAHRMSDEYDGLLRPKKFVWKIIHVSETGLDRWNSFVTTFYSIVFFFSVFKWPHRMLCIVVHCMLKIHRLLGHMHQAPLACTHINHTHVFSEFFFVV